MGADVHYSADQLLAQAGWLGALARTLVADPGEADDLVQETWLAALKRPPTDDRPLRPWLARVARNLARMRRRSEGARGERERSAGRVDREQPTSAELAERLEGQTLLVQALAELDEPYRSTVLLAYFEQRSSAEIAARDGVREGTVRWRLHQGLEQLRTRLDRRHADDRSAWVALLLPLARSEQGALATATAAAGGVLGMGLYLKLSTAAVFVFLVAWLSVRALQRDERELASARMQSNEAVVFAPLAEEAVELAREPDAAARVASAGADSGSAPAASAPAAQVVARLRLALRDESRRPIAGVPVELQPSGALPRQLATSGADGRVGFEIVARAGQPLAAGAQLEVELVTRAPQWTVGVLRPLLHAGEDSDLGELVLRRAGAIRGSVADRDGAPIAGATVALADADEASPISVLEHAEFAGREHVLAESDARGEFLLVSVPPGLTRIRAEKRGLEPATSGFIDVRPMQESRVEPLVLRARSVENLILGVVLDPRGEPVPWAEVEYRMRRLGSSSSGGTATDAQGRFQITAANGGRFSLCVRTRDEALALALLDDVEPGSPELVVQLAQARTFELRVRDSEGRPVESFYASLQRGEQWLERSNTLANPGGLARFRLPPLPFSLHVRAEGYADAELAEIDPARTGPLELRLRALPGLRGRVTLAGSAVAGAQVEVRAQARQRSESDGFPVRVDPDACSVAVTSADGSFVLTVREAGRYFVRASLAGHAPAELGPLEVDPKLGRAGLELALGRGGSVEGSVRVDAGRSAAGLVLAFSRGDAHAFTVRTDAAGRFRAEHLMPGRWMVQSWPQDLLPNQHSSSSAPGPVGEMPFNCEVVEERVTPLEIDLRERPGERFVLHGQLRSAGGELGVWQAQLLRAELGMRAPWASSTRLTSDGSFELDAEAGQRLRLALRALEGPWQGLGLFAELEGGARTFDWEHVLQGGDLELELGRPRERPLAVLWSDGRGLLAFFLVQPAAGETRARAHMPAGHLRVVEVREVDGPAEAWALPALVEGDLGIGGSLSLSLP